jgi:hypothetical protein
MSTSDYRRYLVKDDRLMSTDVIQYAVKKGGQTCVQAQYNAQSQSPNSIIFSVNVPSEQTFIDRRVILKSTYQLTFTATNLPAGQYIINPGIEDALAPFPLFQSFSTVSATINNNTVSINARDVLASILRLYDKRELAAYNGMCPVKPDSYFNYADGVNALNNVLGGFTNSTADNDMPGRGSYPINVISNPVGTGAGTTTAVVEFTSYEPLLISPFVFVPPKVGGGSIHGVQVLNFTFNIADANRSWRAANIGNKWQNYNIGVQLTSVADSQLLFNFLSGHPSDLVPSRCVLPYWEMPRYISQPGVTVNAGASTTLTVSNQTLNQVPDSLILIVRKKMSDQRPYDSDSVFKINSVSINWNNNAGLLSSATPNDLFRYHRESGGNETWLEFSGQAYQEGPPSGATLSTCGSFLMLEFTKHIPIVEDFYSCGSIGSFQLQLQVNVTNQGSVALQPEICLITVNSGLLTSQQGTCNVYTAVLSKEDVLQTSATEAVSDVDMARMVGGGFLDSLKSSMAKALPKLPSVAKSLLGNVDNPKAQAASKALGALGFGRQRLEERLM